MDPEEYDRMYQVEDAHWWYEGMRTLTRAMLTRSYPDRTRLRILDAGCGTGASIERVLNDYGPAAGLDLSLRALHLCRLRKLQRLTQASVMALPYSDESFDLVTSFDVLYEAGVADDRAALFELHRVLVRGGRILIRLPAYEWLRGQHDRVVHTARRYTRTRVKRLLEEAGFKIERITYANTLLFPLALAKRTAERFFPTRKPVSDLSLPIQPLNELLTRILSLEAPWAAGRGLPYGLSVMAVARKS